MATSDPIETPRLRIESFPDAFLTERYVGWLNDPDVVRYSEQRHKKHTLKSVTDYYTAQNKSMNHFLAIEALGVEHLHIGNLGVAVNPNNKFASL